MIKVFLILIGFVILHSCASSTFYAYDNVEDEEYCTIEVNRKGISTYRGIIYPKHADLSYKRFLYMKSDEDNLDGYLQIQNTFFEIYYINEGSNVFDAILLSFKSDSCTMYNDINYVIEKDSAYYSSSNCIKEHPGFLEVNFGYDWLPPYFKKVDKIDYSKFSMFKVKKKFLKNPEKNGSPKSWKQ